MHTSYSGAAPAAPTEPPLRAIGSLRGPRPWPLFGNVLQVNVSRVHQDVERWSRIYGPYFPLYLGRQPLLVVADHEAIAAILRDRPDGFRRPSITARISEEMGGLPGLFLAEGAQWRNQRRMVMQGFAPHAIKAYFPSLVNVALRLQRRWEGAARAGTAIELDADLKRYTVDIIAGLAFGTEVNTLEAGEDVIQRHMDDILPAVSRRSMALIPYWRYVKLPQDRRLERSAQALQHEVGELVAKARARMTAIPALREHPNNLLEAMIAAADQEDSGVDDTSVAGNVLTMLLAGEDTTAHTIGWLIYLLHRHPDALSKVQQEVLHQAPDPAAYSVERLDGLDYLDACVQEAMRLKPVAPFIVLEALRDSAVAGIRVPARSLVWCVLRHHSVADSQFPRAAEFDPQRWLPGPDGTAGADRKVGMPFGAGPRTCPGRYLALLEIKIAMAMLLGRFDISAVDTPHGGEAQELFGFVMSADRLRLRLKLRQP